MKNLIAAAFLALGLAVGGIALRNEPKAQAQDNAGPRDKFAYGSATTTAESTLITPTSGKKFILKAIDLCAVTTAATVTVKDGLAGTTVLTIRCPADTHVTLDARFLGGGMRSGAADNLLTLTNGTSTTVVASARYAEE